MSNYSTEPIMSLVRRYGLARQQNEANEAIRLEKEIEESIDKIIFSLDEIDDQIFHGENY